jgi:hypothetical protein
MVGVMADVAASPNDPIFLSHHGMVDCILEEWLLRHKDVGYPNVTTRGHQRDGYIVPFFPLYKHSDLYKTADHFGYECDIVPGSAGHLSAMFPSVIFMAMCGLVHQFY